MAAELTATTRRCGSRLAVVVRVAFSRVDRGVSAGIGQVLVETVAASLMLAVYRRNDVTPATLTRS